MIIQKFGGTSVGSASRIKHVAQLINDGNRKIVVLSAVSGTTNALVEITKLLYREQKAMVESQLEQLAAQYHELIGELFDDPTTVAKAQRCVEGHFNHIRSYTLDMFTPFEERAVLAIGELISTEFMCLHLRDLGVNAAMLPALDFMRIDQQLEPDHWYIQSNLKRMLGECKDVDLFITQGFICRNHFGEIDNLKRGGSDYTASIIGAAIDAKEVQIWTDIDGMHNNDPRVVKHTKAIERLTYDEAAELAYFGAKILHPSSILPARKADLPVVLKNTMAPERPGTVISNQPSGATIKAVAAKDGITAIKIKSDRMLLAYGFLRKVFEVFERHRIAIDMITTSEVAVSLTIDHDGDLRALIDDLKQYAQVAIDKDQCIISVVGHLIQEEPGHAATILNALKDVPLRMISYGGSKNNISFLVGSADKSKALQALNVGLFNMEA